MYFAIHGCHWWRYSHVFIGWSGSFNRCVLGDHVLRLSKWWSAWLSYTGGCLRGENVLFEEALAGKFSGYSRGFCSRLSGVLYCRDKNNIFLLQECMVVLDRLRTPHPWLVFDSIEDFVDEESQRSEVLFHLDSLGWIQRKDGNACLL